MSVTWKYDPSDDDAACEPDDRGRNGGAGDFFDVYKELKKLRAQQDNGKNRKRFTKQVKRMFGLQKINNDERTNIVSNDGVQENVSDIQTGTENGDCDESDAGQSRKEFAVKLKEKQPKGTNKLSQGSFLSRMRLFLDTRKSNRISDQLIEGDIAVSGEKALSDFQATHCDTVDMFPGGLAELRSGSPEPFFRK